jgi:hypothetical protein
VKKKGKVEYTNDYDKAFAGWGEVEKKEEKKEISSELVDEK